MAKIKTIINLDAENAEKKAIETALVNGTETTPSTKRESVTPRYGDAVQTAKQLIRDKARNGDLSALFFIVSNADKFEGMYM